MPITISLATYGALHAWYAQRNQEMANFKEVVARMASYLAAAGGYPQVATRLKPPSHPPRPPVMGSWSQRLGRSRAYRKRQVRGQARSRWPKHYLAVLVVQQDEGGFAVIFKAAVGTSVVDAYNTIAREYDWATAPQGHEQDTTKLRYGVLKRITYCHDERVVVFMAADPWFLSFRRGRWSARVEAS